jgi:DNA-binding CsgD family transcriptional regulator
MTQGDSATESKPRWNVPRSVGAAAEVALRARGDRDRLSRVVHRSVVPMLIVDGDRRYVDANRPARLTFRLSLEELRTYVISDLTPPHLLDELERAWTQMLQAGCVAGPYQVAGTDGSQLDVVYCAIADLLPGLHLVVFAPADWPEDELAVVGVDGNRPATPLTTREIEVLELAAEGAEILELAEQLGLSPATVRTHLKNIYAKLDAHNRTGAVVRAMRLGLIAG